jgi:hypothetical protein
LYPTPNAGEDDFLDLAELIRPVLDVDVIYVRWPDDVDDLAALDIEQKIEAVRLLGSATHLEHVLPDALAGHSIDVVAFAAPVPASWTDQRVWNNSCAPFAASPDIRRRVRPRRPAGDSPPEVSVYLPDLSDHFIERMREASVEVVHRVDAAARSDRNRQRGPESGSWIS